MAGTSVMSEGNTTMQADLRYLSYSYIITGSLSTIGSASIVMAAILRNKVCSPEIRPLFQLSLADLLASVMLLGISILFNLLPSEHNGMAFYCPYITGMIACFYVCTFLLTVTYAFEVFFKMKARLERRSELALISSNYPILFFLYATSWLLPILTTGVNFAMVSEKNEGFKEMPKDLDICSVCLPVFHYASKDCKRGQSDHTSDKLTTAFTYLFLMCLLSSSAFLIVIYILVLRTFRRAQHSRGVVSASQHKEERRVRRTALLYQAAFLFCWMPSIVLGFLTLAHREFSLSKYFAVYIVQASVSPLQGFLNCFIYGWRREGFKKAMTENSGESSA